MFKDMKVAVKTCNDKKTFFQEVSILKKYDHRNIVKFIGIAAQREPIMMVMEYEAGKYCCPPFS